jgi:hypothetical protein
MQLFSLRMRLSLVRAVGLLASRSCVDRKAPLYRMGDTNTSRLSSIPGCVQSYMVSKAGVAELCAMRSSPPVACVGCDADPLSQKLEDDTERVAREV